MKKFLSIALMAFVLAAAPDSFGSEALSYSGRLVNTNGSPVLGPVDLRFELAYSGNTTTILCSQDISGVSLTNGVFHAKLELTCGSSLPEVLSSVPVGQEVVIRVTNTSATPDKVYSFQALHSVPSAKVAHGLTKLNANTNEVLTWTGSKWEPKPITGATGGTVTSIAAGTGLVGGTITSSGTLSVDVGTSAGKIPQLDAGGKLATSVETDPLVQGFAKSALPTCGTGQVLKANGTALSCVADADTDTTLVADNSSLFTTGPTIGVKAQGLLDTHLSGISASCGVNQILMTNGLGSFACSNKQWGESLGNLFFNTGAVILGGTTPASSAILDLQSTSKGFLPPRLTTTQRDLISSPSAGLMVYNSTINSIQFYNGSVWKTLNGDSIILDSGTLSGTVNLTKSVTLTQDATVILTGYYYGSNFPLVTLRIAGTICSQDRSYAGTGAQYGSATCIKELGAGTHELNSTYGETAGTANMIFHSMSWTVIVKNGTGGSTGGGGGGSLVADSVNSNHVLDNSLTVDDVNFASGEGINVPQLASDPGAGLAGQIYYNSTSKTISYFNGTAWQVLGSGSIAANSVDSSKIVDGSISYADLNLSDGDVPLSKLAGSSDSSLYLRGDKTWANFLTQVLATSFTVTPSNSAIATGDSLQTVVNKTQGQINNLITTSGNHLIKNGTDTITGTVTVSAASGFLKIPLTPSGVDLTDAANVQYVQNYVDASSAWTKSGGNVYRSSGNVGVGTTSPASPLEVNGIIHSSNGGFKFPDGSIQTTASGVTGQAQFDSGWSTMATGSIYTFNHGLGVPPQLIRILAKDNSTGKIIEVSPQYAYGYSTYGGLNGVTSDSSTIKVNTLNINRLGSFLNDANTNANMEFASSQIRILAWASGVTPSIWSQTGLNTYFNSGNVGIGTSSPGAPLDVRGFMRAITEAGHGGIESGVYSDTPTHTPHLLTKRGRGTMAAPSFVQSGDRLGILSFRNHLGLQGAMISSEASENHTASAWGAGLSFYTVNDGALSPTEKMKITSGGNIGMGTPNPTTKLHVVGDYANAIHVEGNSNNSTGLRITNNITSGRSWTLFASGGTPAAVGTFGIHDNTSSTTRFAISPAGNVGIEHTTPAYKLDVNGDINSSTRLRIAGTQVCTSAGCTASSDKRLKKNIRPLENSLEKVLMLQGVEYDYKDQNKFGDKHQVGVIAQEVEKIYPEVVITDPKTGMKSVAYDHLVAPLIEAVKEVNRSIATRASQEEIESIKLENKKLRQENKEIKERLDRIEKLLLKNSK